ncbi:MAG: lysophospholipid acyltransferase family protein [Candidatus Nanopelagicaceae bacterium]
MAELVYPPVIGLFKLVWRGLDIQFHFEGQDNLPKKGGAVIASNHVSYLDFAFIGTGALHLKRYIRFMAKKGAFDNKIAGPLLRGMKHISVDRDNGGASFVAALKALRSGEIVGIFPEATISQSFEIKGMKSGAVRLAIGAQVPIIPVVIWGSQRIWTKGVPRDFRRKSIPIHIAYGEPIYFAKDADVDASESLLRESMIAMLHKVQESYPDSHVGERWAPQRLGGTAPAPAVEG